MCGHVEIVYFLSLQMLSYCFFHQIYINEGELNNRKIHCIMTFMDVGFMAELLY